MDCGGPADMICFPTTMLVGDREVLQAWPQEAETSAASVESPQSMRAFLARLTRTGELRTLEAPSRPISKSPPASPRQGTARRLLSSADARRTAIRHAGRRQSSEFPAPLRRRARLRAARNPKEADRGDRKTAPAQCSRTAPCQETAVSDPDLEQLLPIPRFFEKESGRYITAGAIVARDTVSGVTNLSIARVMPLGGSRAFVGIAPNHHLAIMARAARARGAMLDIAVCIGNHPAFCRGLSLSRSRRRRTSDRRRPSRRAARRRAMRFLRPIVPHIANVCSRDSSTRASLSRKARSANITACTKLRRRDRRELLAFDASPRCVVSGCSAGLSSRTLLARRRRHRGRHRPRRTGRCASFREVAVGLGGAGRFHAVVSMSAPSPERLVRPCLPLGGSQPSQASDRRRRRCGPVGSCPSGMGPRYTDEG